MPQRVNEPETQHSRAEIGGDGVHGGSRLVFFRQQTAAQQQLDQCDDDLNGNIEDQRPAAYTVIQHRYGEIDVEAALCHQIHQQKYQPASLAPVAEGKQ